MIEDPHWTVRWSWRLLLAALIAVPLVMGLPFLGTGLRPYAGPNPFKLWVAQALVFGSLALFALALVRGRAVLRWDRVMWVPAAYVGWAAVSTAASPSPGTAIIGYHTNGEGLLSLLVYATTALLVVQHASGAARVRELLSAAGLSGAVVGAYGLLQTAGLDPVDWERPWGAFRSSGTIGNPDMFGAFMLLNAFVLAGLLLTSEDGRNRLLYGSATVVAGLSAFTSLTRAAWLGGVVGIIALALLLFRQKARLRTAETAVAVALLVGVLGAAAVSSGSVDPDSNVVSRVTSAVDADSSNTSGRLETWRIGLAGVAQRPVFGWGPDTFPLAFEPNKTPDFAKLVAPNIVQGSAHSFLIQTMSDTGVPGVLLWLVTIAVVAFVAGKRLLAKQDTPTGFGILAAGAWASCAAYVAAALLTPSSAAAGLLFWALLGMLLSPMARTIEPRPSRKLPKVAAWAALGLASAGVTVSLALVAADANAVVASDATADPERRVRAGENAVRLNPLSAEYAAVAAKAHADRMLELASDGAPDDVVESEFGRSRSLLDKAIALEPTNPRRKTTMVGLLLMGANNIDKRYTTEALELAGRTIEEAPNDLVVPYWYARALHQAGRPQEAIPLLDRVFRMRPDNGDVAVLLSDLVLAQGDSHSARWVLETSLAAKEDAMVRQWLLKLDASES